MFPLLLALSSRSSGSSALLLLVLVASGYPLVNHTTSSASTSTITTTITITTTAVGRGHLPLLEGHRFALRNGLQLGVNYTNLNQIQHKSSSHTTYNP